MDYKDIEHSIIKKYRKDIWAKFIRAINDYEMINNGDKIAVCISGGKDSMILAKCLEELKRHGKIKFELEFIVMNPGYNLDNLNKIKANLKTLNISAVIFNSDIFAVANSTNKSSKNNPCYLCARMRRGYLYDKAKELGCNKIALGHHMNDVVETILMNMIYNGTYSSMMPKLHSDNFQGMELIRPLYYVLEDSIISWANYNNLSFIDCACSVTKKGLGKRAIIKQLTNSLLDIYSDSLVNILTSSSNVNLDTIIAYKQGNIKHHFKDLYDINTDAKNN